MYVYINGTIEEKNIGSAVIETGGVGYLLKIGAMTYNDLPSEGEKVKLFTYHYVREDREELYGFSTKGEKELFEILIGVSNIGPSKAMDILSEITPALFAEYIMNNNIKNLSAVKGIGAKTAKRLVLELKDKLKTFKPAGDFKGSGIVKLDEAISGLKSLGYRESTARELVEAVRDSIKKDDQPQEIIRKALKNAG